MASRRWRPQRQPDPDPPGNEMPIGKRVCESPPVPTVSGSNMRFNQLWIMPSPGRSETPPRFMMKVWQGVLSVDIYGLGIGRGVTERLHGQVGMKSPGKPDLSVHHGSLDRWCPVSPQWSLWVRNRCRGESPSTPQALPTIFCARV